MPIVDIKTHGDLTAIGSFRPQDTKIIASTRAHAKMARVLSRIPAPIELHFVHLPKPFSNYEIDRHFCGSGVGFLPSQQVEKTYQVSLPERPLALTVMLVENEGREWIPLTPWMVAHRLAHALVIRNESRSDMQRLIRKFDDELCCISNAYCIDNSKTANMFGTARSSRKYLLSRYTEWFFECFAQYCVTGAIRFNPARRVFGYQKPGTMAVKLKDDIETAAIDAKFTELSNNMTWMFDCFLRTCAGRVVVL